jgi:peptidoglycan/LPS O-acetylase OafA/YrhL
VAAVVVEHVFSGEGPRLLQGLGETGVAMFFGLSGYLITGLLLAEVRRTGTVRLGQFYVRRAARLLPALVVVLVVCDLGFWLTGRDGFLRPSLYALAYVSNYATVLGGDYLMGFGQTWSLAVEEHFYLLWPVVLLLAARRGGTRTVVSVALVGCAVAVGWRLVLVLLGDPQLLLYHGTLERADALLYGCAAAALVARGWRPSGWVLPTSALVLAGVVAVSDGGPVGRVAVQMVLGVAAAGLAAGLDTGPGERARRMLSWRPVVLVGVLSYGLYLWHWPLFSLFGPLTGYRVWPQAIVAVTVLPVAAAVSYLAVERPVRTRVRRVLGARRTTGSSTSPSG